MISAGFFPSIDSEEEEESLMMILYEKDAERGNLVETKISLGPQTHFLVAPKSRSVHLAKNK